VNQQRTLMKTTMMTMKVKGIMISKKLIGTETGEAYVNFIKCLWLFVRVNLRCIDSLTYLYPSVLIHFCVKQKAKNGNVGAAAGSRTVTSAALAGAKARTHQGKGIDDDDDDDDENEDIHLYDSDDDEYYVVRIAFSPSFFFFTITLVLTRSIRSWTYHRMKRHEPKPGRMRKKEMQLERKSPRRRLLIGHTYPNTTQTIDL
jgi:hypothetical protein